MCSTVSSRPFGAPWDLLELPQAAPGIPAFPITFAPGVVAGPIRLISGALPHCWMVQLKKPGVNCNLSHNYPLDSMAGRDSLGRLEVSCLGSSWLLLAILGSACL